MKTNPFYQDLCNTGNITESHEGIPALKLKKVLDSIDLYKKMVAITVLGNTIIAILAAVYVR